MKFTRILSALLVLALLAVCPGSAFAQSDVANKTIDFWIDCIDYLAPSFGYSTEWYYSELDADGTSKYELWATGEDSLDCALYGVEFSNTDGVRGVDVITITRVYSKYAFDTPFVSNQLAFIVWALYGISHMYTDPELAGVEQVITDALNCAASGLESPGGMMYVYCGSSVMIGVAGYPEEQGQSSADIGLVCDTGESSLSGSLTMPMDFSFLDLYDIIP